MVTVVSEAPTQAPAESRKRALSILGVLAALAVRVALTGRTASPGLFEMMALLGRDETIARLNAVLAFLARSR